VIGPYERTESRTNQRNGSRPRTLSTIAGDLELRIPKLRTGSFFPALLERRRRVDQCLFAVVMEAYLHGTSTRKVDDLVKALGADSGISKSEVSRICADLDTEVKAFRDRPLTEQCFPYVFLDATYCKARVNHRVVSQAVVIATGVAADIGAAWQRCRVHFLRNVFAQVPKGSAEMVAAAIRTIFAQPGAEHVREQLDTIAHMLGRQLPKVESMLGAAADDITAFADFPVLHWKKIWSTNPLESLNKEIKRRTDVVGVFPNPRHCCVWPDRCSLKPTTNGKSPTNATFPKPPWPSSTRPATPTINPLPSWPPSRHSGNRHSLGANRQHDFPHPRGASVSADARANRRSRMARTSILAEMWVKGVPRDRGLCIRPWVDAGANTARGLGSCARSGHTRASPKTWRKSWLALLGGRRRWWLCRNVACRASLPERCGARYRPGDRLPRR
jgi:putative transposase